jgi:biopolymer transport protein ExbB/TolQ
MTPIMLVALSAQVVGLVASVICLSLSRQHAQNARNDRLSIEQSRYAMEQMLERHDKS